MKTDNELRGVILQAFYDLRKEMRQHQLLPSDLNGMEEQEYERISYQLAEYGLLDWSASIDVGYGSGKITARGIDVVEQTARPPISIALNDHSVRITGSSNVQVGHHNSLNAQVSLERLFQVVEGAHVPDEAKAEAKSLLTRLSNNPTFASVVAAIVAMAPGIAH